jgi:hypothetical protein
MAWHADEAAAAGPDAEIHADVEEEEVAVAVDLKAFTAGMAVHEGAGGVLPAIYACKFARSAVKAD